MARPRRGAARPLTTLEFPRALPVERDGDAWSMTADGHDLRLTNLDKVYWPGDGITKGDLLTYYWNVAPLLLPHLHDRPLTMHRMPEGLAGKPFYEKQVPVHAPRWLATAEVPADDGEKLIDMVMAQDAASLLWVANLGCIEMHPLHSRAASPDNPDYAFFDLDPFEPYTFADVRAVARLIHVVLEGLGLRGYPKTSGATGMQIFVPLDGTSGYTETRAFVERVGRMVLAAYPEKVTMDWAIERRTGKVFVDHNMNRRGANIASVYSVRPQPRGPISTPLEWEQVDEDIEPVDFRMEHVGDLLAAGDRFAAVRTDLQSLHPAMQTLGIEPPSQETVQPGRRRSRWSSSPSSTGTARRARRAELATYDSKRDFAVTPEPAPAPSAPEPPGARPAGLAEAPELVPGRRFTIQQHHARRLHHDVRFEHDGVLVSFAVPKRLPDTPGARHLAVPTEDHPLDYLTFSGEIPAGQYGGGSVRLFDVGSYDPIEVADGKWQVRLNGARYQGAEYHFVRTSSGEWLVLLSARTPVPEPPAPPAIAPMLASSASRAFDDDGWVFEAKWDGHRCLAALGGGTGLTSRSGRDVTDRFPELDGLHIQLAARNALVDGEVVALDEQGKPSFACMQDRFHRSPAELARNRGRIPVQYLAFDLLWLDGVSLMGLPLSERSRRLAEVLVPSDTVRISTAIPSEGVAVFDAAKDAGLEGVVAKRAASLYHPGKRSADWIKIKANKDQDCAIVGWTEGQGGRGATLGALLLGVMDGGRLRFAGSVGTGFDGALLASLTTELKALEAPEPAIAGAPRQKGAHWVRPKLVCSVQYLEWTRDGRLRAPSFKGLREDKAPEDCVVEEQKT